MLDTYQCSSKEFLENSRMAIRIMETEQSIYEEMAQIMVDMITQNQGKPTVFICPVGPIAHYPIFVRKVNDSNISLKNVWFFNMDEYLDDQDQMIPTDNPLSFRGFMDRVVYSKIKPGLVMPKEQRLFPTPGKEQELDELLENLGNAVCCLTGVGINGHLAFNEPPDVSDPITDEEYAQISTRCLDLSKETIVNNGSRKIKGALDIMPRRCVSLGMRQILAAKMIKIYLYCDWQWGIMRKIVLEPPTRLAPASLLQLHPNSEMVISRELLDTKLSLP
jgi:glucosamine-6-phosphate deaminase